VLCYLQGKTYREASAELGLPLGTVSAHLSRARAMLRDALARRGVVISTATLASVLCGHAAVEARSAALVDQTVQAALVGPQGCGGVVGLALTRAAVLSQGVLRAMAIAKLKTVGVVSVVVVLVAASFGAVAYHYAPVPDRHEVESAASPAGEPMQRTDEKKEVQRPKPPTLADRYRALVAAWKDDCCIRYPAELEKARTNAEREAVKPPDTKEWSRKKWALVMEAPNDPVVLEILCTIVVYHCWEEEAHLALDRLHRDFVKDPRLGPLCHEFTKSPDASAEKFLRAVMAEHPDPEVRDRAAFALAYHLRWCVLQQHTRCRQTEISNLPPELQNEKRKLFTLEPEEEVRLLKEVEGICRNTIAKYAEEEWFAFPSTKEEMLNPARTTMGKEARAVLDSLDKIDIRRLAEGQPAPEIASIDSEGKPLKLSEFRGKVVLLSFGGQSCKPCRAMIPHERELVKRLEGQPFALIGFDGVYKEEGDTLKEFLVREKVTWRVCPGFQPGSSYVFQAWNVQSIPVFYLIDDRGVIRQRFDGYTEGKVLDAAVDGLMREAEVRSSPPKIK
jgi:thiol-disulfide isomerase/thioredoxin